MIEAQGLTKRYGPRNAIEDISFTVERGEILGFLGPNGAGKTTTMRILTGYMPPTEGSATIAGHDVFSDSLAARRHIGYLPESVPLYLEMSVAGYLDYMARLRRLPKRREALQRAMDLVHIADRADDRIGKLSKGYRQRVGLAQALLHDPPVLILDEPTVGLDPRQIIEVRELIRDLGGERTIILSTHILPEVSQTCNRIVIINKGRVVAVDTPDNLTARLRGSETLFVQVDAMGGDAEGTLSSIPGVTRVSMSDKRDSVASYEVDSESGRDVRRELAATVVGRGWGLLELRPMRMGLEEIFLKVITEDAVASEAVVSEAAASEPIPEASRE